MEIFIRIPFDRPTERRGLFAVVGGDLKESVRFLRKDKPIFIRVVALLAVFNFVLSAVMIVGIPVMVVSVLGMGDLHLGIAQGALGLGGLAGGLLSGVFSEKLKLRSTYLILAVCSLTAAVMGVALLPFVSAFLGYLLICAAGFIAMATATMFTVQLCAAIQRQTPPCLIGKIMAFVLMIANCASPLGQALYGLLFDALSEMPFVILFAASAVGILIALLSKKTFVRLDREESPPPAHAETPCE